jgi:transcriptional regulator with XRE-family HTH domain
LRVSKSLFTRKHTQLRKLLTKARKDAKLTQTELAERINRRQAYISRIERGERRIDVVEFLELAHAIGINAAKFIATFERTVQN